MPIFNPHANEINANPKTPLQLRAALVALQKKLSQTSSVETVVFPSAVNKGELVRIDSSGEAVAAQADSDTNSKAVVFAAESVGAGEVGSYLESGFLELSDWTSITGSSNLTLEAQYYLSESSAGTMTTTAPSASGDVVLPVGWAVSTKKFMIRILDRTFL